MKDVLTSWPFLTLVVVGVALVWPDVVWQGLRTLADLPSLGAYMPR